MRRREKSGAKPSSGASRGKQPSLSGRVVRIMGRKREGDTQFIELPLGELSGVHVGAKGWLLQDRAKRTLREFTVTESAVGSCWASIPASTEEILATEQLVRFD
jgi:hypothetical protein